MNKTAKAIICILCIVCLALGGLLIWSRVDLSNYKLYKNIISQNEVEQTLFGQPISEERNGEYRIGIKTATDGDFHAKLTIYQAQDGKYAPVFSPLKSSAAAAERSSGDQVPSHCA